MMRLNDGREITMSLADEQVRIRVDEDSWLSIRLDRLENRLIVWVTSGSRLELVPLAGNSIGIKIPEVQDVD